MVFMDVDARLAEAARAGETRKVKALLEKGAKPTSPVGADGATPVHLAVKHPEVLSILLENGGKRAAAKPDAAGRTPLMAAVDAANAQSIKLLLDAGADVNARDREFGNTAIRAAAFHGSPEIVKMLLAAGADPTLRGRMLLSAIDRARERKTPEGRMISVILERHLAAAAQQRSVVKKSKRARG